MKNYRAERYEAIKVKDENEVTAKEWEFMAETAKSMGQFFTAMHYQTKRMDAITRSNKAL